MSGNSSVGNRAVYENGDQKNVPHSEIEQQKKDLRFHEGQEHSHKANDSSMWRRQDLNRLQTANVLTEDQRTIANKLEREEKREHEPEPMSAEERAAKIDPTLPVSHLYPTPHTTSAWAHTDTLSRRQGCTVTSQAVVLRRMLRSRRRRRQSSSVRARPKFDSHCHTTSGFCTVGTGMG